MMAGRRPVVDLLQLAARRGSTVLPVDVAVDVLRSRASTRRRSGRLRATGAVLELDWRGAPALALAELAEAEELTADGLLELAGQNRLAVVVGASGAARRSAVESALGSASTLVLLDEAQLLGIEQVATAVEELAEDAVLAIALDPALPLAPLPGAVALDLAGSGICPVLRAASDPPASGTDSAAAAVAGGTYPGATPDRAVVEVVVDSPEAAVRRLLQLVSDSIPRTFDVAADQVLVLTREETGPTGADALSETLGRAVPNLHAAPGARAEAAVVVLGGARPISRSELYAALRAGSRHVSLVLPAGVSLAEAAVREEPPRRTRLPELLAAAPDA